jgi:hypothetical protein
MAKYGLVIGINDYPGTASDLSGCVNDANDWKAALEKRGFSVDRLLDKQATGKAMREAMRATIARAKSGDVVVIQFSGHGSFVPDLDGDEPDGVDECLCPHDVMTRGPITDDELFDLYDAKAKGVRLLALSDSCHSGTVARLAPILTPPTTTGRFSPTRRVRFLPPSVFLSRRAVAPLGIAARHRAASAPGRYAALLMAGCQDAEYSYDAYFRGRPNGAFTYVALRALEALPEKATYAGWFREIRKLLPSQQYPQTPNLFGTASMKRWQVLE